MEKVKVYYDKAGNTLNVWFDDPNLEDHSEETTDEVILNKDVNGRVIGFEKLNFRRQQPDDTNDEAIPVEILMR